MCDLLQVRWTVTPTIAPQPWIACNGCGGPRPFRCSDKIRLNANGRRLDAWLIYKCTGCDRSWNRPIFERRSVRDVDARILQALQSNDPDFIRGEAFDIEALRRATRRIDEFAQFSIRKKLLRELPGWRLLEIEFATALPLNVRLDRLLASEMGMTRSKLAALHEAGLIKANSTAAGFLRRRIRNGLRVTVDLSQSDDREQVWKPLAIGVDP